MTYRYKLLYSPKTLDEIVAALRDMQHTNTEYFASFRTREKECGRPIDGLRKPRWFDEKRDPGQLWFPFEEYTPVRMPTPMQIHPGVWRCDFIIARMGAYSAFVNTDDRSLERHRVPRLQALEVYKRVRTGEPIDPFVQRRVCSSNGGVIMNLPTALVEYLEDEVARLTGRGAAVLTMDGNFYTELDVPVARYRGVERDDTAYRVYVDFPDACVVILWPGAGVGISTAREAADTFRYSIGNLT
jgi:hypothetical protein